MNFDRYSSIDLIDFFSSGFHYRDLKNMRSYGFASDSISMSLFTPESSLLNLNCQNTLLAM